MLIIPGLPPLRETTHSRELRRRVEAVVRAYQRENPAATDADVSTALAQSTPGGHSPEMSRRRAIGIAIAVLLGAGFAVMAVTGGGTRFENSFLVWRVIGGAAAAAAVAIAIVRLVRKSD